MADIGYAKLPVPGGGDAPTTPGDLAALAQAIDPHLVQHVADKAERDATYANAPLHTVVGAADGTFWKKTSSSSNTWVTLWEPLPAWRPIALASGIGVSGDTPPSIRLIGECVYLIGTLDKTDGTNFTGDGLVIATVPSDCIPSRRRRYIGAASVAGDTTDAAVRIEISGTTDATPGQVIVWYQAPGGSPWFDLSGSYWKDGPA